MTAAALQTFTVIGLRSDVDMHDLFIAGVQPGPVADEFVILETSEADFTRWAMEFDATDADTAAVQAYTHCRTDSEWGEDTETAGDLLQAVLRDVSITSGRSGDYSVRSEWISVDPGDGGEIFISGTGDTENQVDYSPAEHHGWYATYDASVLREPIVLHDSGNADFRTDTAAVIEAVRRFLTAVRRAPAK
jgi:hypothetical protein